MNTMRAFIKADMARLKGVKEKKYDYVKALKLAKKYKVKKVAFFMNEDEGWTRDELTLKEIKDEKMVAGINGSVWATPMIEINGDRIECWK